MGKSGLPTPSATRPGGAHHPKTTGHQDYSSRVWREEVIRANSSAAQAGSTAALAHSKSGRGGTINYRNSGGGGGGSGGRSGRGGGSPSRGDVDCTDPTAYRSFVNASMHTNGMRNRQVRMLAGAHMDYVGSEGAHVIDQRDAEEDEAALFVEAVAHLAAAEAVVTVEHFSLSIVVLSHMFGAPAPPTYTVVKEAVEMHMPPPVDVETGNLVRRLNSVSRCHVPCITLCVLCHDELVCVRVAQWPRF